MLTNEKEKKHISSIDDGEDTKQDTKPRLSCLKTMDIQFLR